MERNELINEIVDFCFDYKIVEKTDKRNEIRNKIKTGLKKCDFIEVLIEVIYQTVIDIKTADFKKIKIIILELESIRLDLEYKDILESKKDKYNTDVKNSN